VKIKEKKQLLIKLSEWILRFIRQRVRRPKNGSIDCEIFTDFFEYFKRDGMANYSYTEAKHLPELRDVSGSHIRDFLATVKKSDLVELDSMIEKRDHGSQPQKS